MKNGVIRVALVLSVFVICSQALFAQFTVQHQQPTVLDRNSTNTLEFFVPGVNQNDIFEALLFFKNEGDLGYSQKEVGYQGGVFTALISPDELVGTSFEYYFQLSLLNSDQDLFFPDNLPAENPITVNIVEGQQFNELPTIYGIDYSIFTPYPGNALELNEAYKAMAFFSNKD